MKLIDLSNMQFGNLTVAGNAGFRRAPNGTLIRLWKCRCICGSETIVASQHLRNGGTVSCGCHRRKVLAEGTRTTHGQSQSITHKTWLSMRQRCNSPNAVSYRRYGGAGISVCERWQDSFANFLADMGERPSQNHSIDRIDGTRGYEPGNCRWATAKEQANNQRDNVRIEYQGETLTLTQWSERLGLPYHTLKRRYRALGWSVHRTFTEPVQIGRRRVRHADLP